MFHFKILGNNSWNVTLSPFSLEWKGVQGSTGASRVLDFEEHAVVFRDKLTIFVIEVGKVCSNADKYQEF